MASLEHVIVAVAEQQAQHGSAPAAQGVDSVAATVAGGAEPAAALGQSALSWSGYIQAVGIIFLLVAVLCLVLWLGRRFGKFSFLPRPGALPRGALVMEAQLPLGPRKGLMVVRFLNRRLLLGVTDQQITLLTEEQAPHDQDVDFQQIMEEAHRNTDCR